MIKVGDRYNSSTKTAWTPEPDAAGDYELSMEIVDLASKRRFTLSRKKRYCGLCSERFGCKQFSIHKKNEGCYKKVSPKQIRALKFFMDGAKQQ